MPDSFGGESSKSLGDKRPLELDWSLQFTQPATSLAHAYWRSACAGRTMPRRSDLDPTAMRKFTAHVGLIELRTDQQRDVEYFIRRAGTKWEEVYGPITGRFIQEFLSPELEAQWRKLFDAVRDAQKPLRATAGIEYQDKRWLDAEMFTAPLGEDGVVKMLFMTFVAFSVSASA